MTEKLRCSLNRKKSVGVIFIDFQKAFDCAFHQLLPIKLQASGIFCLQLDLRLPQQQRPICVNQWLQRQEQ